MTALERAGLRPVGIDLSAFGMIRAPQCATLARSRRPASSCRTGSYEDARHRRRRRRGCGRRPRDRACPRSLYCNLGDVTNLAVARGVNCLFTRIVAIRYRGIAQKLAERRELTLEHSRQWLNHVGLERPGRGVEGDPEIVAATREILDEGAAKLADEFRLSLDYYGAQEGAVAVDEIVSCGAGTTIPGLVERLQRELGYPVRDRPGPPRSQHLDEAAAARLTVSYGLALEELDRAPRQPDPARAPPR